MKVDTKLIIAIIFVCLFVATNLQTGWSDFYCQITHVILKRESDIIFVNIHSGGVAEYSCILINA